MRRMNRLSLSTKLSVAELSFEPSQLRSVGHFEQASAPVTLTTATSIVDTRRSLISLVPGRITYRVWVPPEAVLTFSVGGYVPLHALPEPIQFRLLVDAGEGAETVFEETIRFEFRDHWRDQSVDLAKWSGRMIHVSFDSQPAGEHPPAEPDKRTWALWANPVLASLSWKEEEPSLVLISVDCLRASHVGVYGYERNTTPQIDSLAADGVIFGSAWSTSSWTLPSHVSMMTGMPPSVHGVVDRWKKIYSSLSYLPDILSRSGYETNGIATFTLVSQTYGFEKGFSQYRTLHERPAETIVDEALTVMSGSRGRRKFLFMHLFDAHDPYYPPERELWHRFGPRPKDMTDLLDKVDKRVPPVDQNEIQEVINLYDAEIVYLDQELGRFFDGLKELGLYDGSLIILTADHGEAFFEHGHWTHVVSLYEEVVGVPLIVKWPGNTPRGRVDRPVSLIDIFPTFLGELGIPPGPIAGFDLRRLAAGDEEILGERMIVSEITWGPLGDQGPWPPIMKFAVRSGSLKYMATFENPSGGDAVVGDLVEEELFDLAMDAAEKNDLLPEASARAAPLRRWLLDYLRSAEPHKPLPPDGEVELDEEEKERLKSLGYIGG